MFGASLRCPVCNKYAPDRCTCKKGNMKITNANGVTGFLLNPYHAEGGWVFRVYEGGSFTDYELHHSDLCVTINDADACFYEGGGRETLDHSPDVTGIKEE